MTENEFLKELTQRKEYYLKKSKVFNDRKTILFTKPSNTEDIIEFSKNNNIFFDQIFNVETEDDIVKTINKYKCDVNYFFWNDVITDQLYKGTIEDGIKLDNIYVGPTKHTYVDLYDKRDNIYKNAGQICKVFNFLDDNKSKNVYWNILVRLCLQYQWHYFYETEDFIQYFPNEFEFTNNEVYLDAGVYDGKNIYQFMDKIEGNYQYIYGIEADPHNFKRSVDNLREIKNLELYPKALHCKNEIISFLSTDSSSKKGNAHVQPNGDIIVQGIKGDCLKNKPTFIKMDIEGSEKDALEGLRETIMNEKPKLAICIYHFQEDFWEVPLKMKELNPKYKLMIRNHEKMFCLIESVCYAYTN